MRSPVRSDLIIYSCYGDSDAKQNKGVYLYDGKRRKNVLLYRDSYFTDLQQHFLWSKDGRYVILESNELLHVIDTTQYRNIDLSDALFGKAQKMRLAFKGWAADGRTFAFVLRGPFEKQDFPEQGLFYSK